MNKETIDNLEKILIEKFENLIKDIPSYVVKIGVFIDEEDNKRKKEGLTKINKKGEKVRKKVDKADINKGLTNSQIMFIMENGSPLNNIPARPVLTKTIEYAENNLKKQYVIRGLKSYFANANNLDAFEKELLIMCMKMESYAKTGIRHRKLGLIPNRISTIEAKGSDIPLLDTGQLANSIQCRLYRWGTEEVKKKMEVDTKL